ncbi:MAG: GNAT family N-acetyltransferase [Phycisphaeraceae bacterium]
MTTTAERLALTQVKRSDDPLLHDVWQIRAACAEHLAQRFGDGHWAKVTSVAQLRRLAGQKHLYAVRRGDQTLATFVLARKGPPFLQPKLFRDPEAPAAFLTALAVQPEHQGHGIGRWSMHQAETIARDWGCRSLRFDAYDHAAGAWPFYDREGYDRRAKLDVYGVRLIAYERVL